MDSSTKLCENGLSYVDAYLDHKDCVVNTNLVEYLNWLKALISLSIMTLSFCFALEKKVYPKLLFYLNGFCFFTALLSVTTALNLKIEDQWSIRTQLGFMLIFRGPLQSFLASSLAEVQQCLLNALINSGNRDRSTLDKLSQGLSWIKTYSWISFWIIELLFPDFCNILSFESGTYLRQFNIIIINLILLNYTYQVKHRFRDFLKQVNKKEPKLVGSLDSDDSIATINDDLTTMEIIALLFYSPILEVVLLLFGLSFRLPQQYILEATPILIYQFVFIAYLLAQS